MQDVKTIKNTRDRLNKVGPGFCAMKWWHQTLYLHTGDNHSCYHPRPHHIPVEEIKANPAALHNTKWKKEQRKIMLEGGRPDECYYCWNIEDLEGDHLSDRMIHSSSSFAINELESLGELDWDADVNPRYLEVSFGNGCNYRCGYCCPQASTLWMDEVKKHGNYDLTYNQYGIEFLEHGNYYGPKEENPYIEAFWKWFPEAVKHMTTFRITGGEPLLSKHTKKVIQYLIDNPQPKLKFAINTNGCPPKGLWEEFTQLIKQLEDTKSIKEFTLYTSAESTGIQAEYSRDGMDWHQFTDNVEYFARNTRSKVSFMSAFNIFSLPTFKDFLIWVLHLKATYSGENRWNQRILIDIPYVRNPAFLDIKIANPQIVDDYLRPALTFMEQNTDPRGFKTVETAKLKRIVEDVDHRFNNKDKFWKEQQEAQNMFFKFILQYDRRRQRNFLNTFPEYEGFFEIIKNV